MTKEGLLLSFGHDLDLSETLQIWFKRVVTETSLYLTVILFSYVLTQTEKKTILSCSAELVLQLLLLRLQPVYYRYTCVAFGPHLT